MFFLDFVSCYYLAVLHACAGVMLVWLSPLILQTRYLVSMECYTNTYRVDSFEETIS